MIGYFFFGQLAVVSIWAAAAWALDAYGRRQVPEGPFDAIIVPGCAVRPDGRPSGALARRTRHAVDLFKSGRAATLILTGGVGRHPPSEAEAAAQYAIERGVPEANIVLESRSTSTRENAAYAAETMPKHLSASVLVVTDGYHCWRCRRLFGRHFSTVHTAGSVPGPRLRVRGAMREVISIARMLMTFSGKLKK